MLFRLQRYESFLVWQKIFISGQWLAATFISQLFLRAILPALAGGLQTFVQLALQQFFGGQFGHILRHINARLIESQQLYLFVAAFGTEQQAEGLLLARLLTLLHFDSGVRLPLRGTIS